MIEPKSLLALSGLAILQVLSMNSDRRKSYIKLLIDPDHKGLLPHLWDTT